MRFWVSISLGLLMSLIAFAQAPAPARSPAVKPRKANELTLAGLRPGRDLLAQAVRLYGKGQDDGEHITWGKYCVNELLDVEDDNNNKIQVVRASKFDWHGDCVVGHETGWKTGRGLALEAPSSRVIQLYGEPDSRSPSTKAGRKLELLYYAFDWAGADVPQVMEVLCTVEDDGKPGRVVEITLAAPSL